MNFAIKEFCITLNRTLQNYFAGIFPRDNPKNTRFAINFFTCIGLGGLTYDLVIYSIDLIFT